MGLGDKAKAKAEEIAGKAKEQIGKISDNDELRREGQTDQVGSKAKQAGEDIKDGASTIRDSITDEGN